MLKTYLEIFFEIEFQFEPDFVLKLQLKLDLSDPKEMDLKINLNFVLASSCRILPIVRIKIAVESFHGIGIRKVGCQMTSS